MKRTTERTALFRFVCANKPCLAKHQRFCLQSNGVRGILKWKQLIDFFLESHIQLGLYNESTSIKFAFLFFFSRKKLLMKKYDLKSNQM